MKPNITHLALSVHCVAGAINRNQSSWVIYVSCSMGRTCVCVTVKVCDYIYNIYIVDYNELSNGVSKQVVTVP